MEKAKRATIKISGIEVEVFQLPDGEYVMSQSQVAKATELQGVYVLRFLDEKWLEGKLHKPYTNYRIEIESNGNGSRGGSRIKAISIQFASEFWFEQAIKGNAKAQALTQACLQEALKRRCDRAFGCLKDEQEYESESIRDRLTWEQSRHFLRDAHSSFVNCCMANTFMASVSHDKITLAVCGKSAKELRELEVINGSPKVGLNHIDNRETLVKIAKVKLLFSRYRTGNVSQRIDGAMQELEYPVFKKVV